MSNDADSKDKKIATELSNWERAIFAVSLPHAAAFGAFVGKLDFTVGQESPPKSFVNLVLIVLLLPVVSFWLIFVHDQLRNTFLRGGHMGKFLKAKHTIIYSIIFVSPVALLFLAHFNRELIEVSVFGPISMVLLTWMFSSVALAGHYYRQILKTLGIESDD